MGEETCSDYRCPGKQDSIRHSEHALADLDQVPERIKSLESVRLEKTKEIYAELQKLANSYRTLYEPVQKFVADHPLAKEKFQINFRVSVEDTGFEELFFTWVSHGVTGSFCGVEPGSKAVRQVIGKHDFNSPEGVSSFVTEIADCLHTDRRPGSIGEIKVADQLRTTKGKTVASLYDFIFGLEYLRPRYVLRMGEKELHELSPGERGCLLLVFYLLVDRRTGPLLIDQPEENLDNQTVYDVLVQCIKDIRKRRQVFLVTHNPNLAVVCDADQIICAELGKCGEVRLQYTPGALENPVINRRIVDVLEGTRPAFDKRDAKYMVQ